MSKGRGKGRPTPSGFRVGIVLVVLALVGGYILTVRGNQTPATSQAEANPVVVTDEEASSYYREVSIQRIADVIETSDHSLVYYRSPT